MEMYVTGQLVLGELRQHILAILIGHPLFAEAEQLRATHFADECEDVVRLTRWGASVRAEITRREADTARQRYHHATHDILRRLRAMPFRGHYFRSPRPLPAGVPGALLPDRADRRAGTFDCVVAARFRPADSLPSTLLLNLPAR